MLCRRILPYSLLYYSRMLHSGRPLVTETLHALCSNTKIVKEAHNKGMLISIVTAWSLSAGIRPKSLPRALHSEVF